jgi:hypothetical protein
LGSGTLSTFAGSTFTKTDILTSVSNPIIFSADSAGANIFTQQNGNGVVVATGDGGTTQIDTNVFAGYMQSTGTTVVYIDRAGNLKNSPVVTPVPVTLVTGGANGEFGPQGLSPSGLDVVFFKTLASTGLTDIFMADTTTPGQTATTLDSQTTGGYFAAFWTADGTYNLFYDPIALSSGLGTFKVINTTTKTVATLGTNVWNDFALGTTGAKVAYNDNCSSSTVLIYAEQGDIKDVDLTTSTTGTPIVSKADVNFYPSTDGSKVVYTYNVSPSVNGIYWATAP